MKLREDLVGLSGGKAPGIGNISVGLLKGRDKAMTRGLHAVLPAWRPYSLWWPRGVGEETRPLAPLIDWLLLFYFQKQI